MRKPIAAALELTTAPCLADTWWFGLSRRLSDDAFQSLAALRASQGFSAVQLVVGVPPEVAPDDPNGQGPTGPAWSAATGSINVSYLEHARRRIDVLLGHGLTPIVYGAWGYQIDWIGVPAMREWWRAILRAMEDRPVVYCLTGESNLRLDGAPDVLRGRMSPATRLLRCAARAFIRPALLRQRAAAIRYRRARARRTAAWTAVLTDVHQLTDRPIIIHPVIGECGCECVDAPRLLAMHTFQTGHDESSRELLVQLYRRKRCRDIGTRNAWINLEPWFEGIRDRFGLDDQLFAYWICLLSGAAGYCYGAHGVWNVGDGDFLADWGQRSYGTAIASATPAVIGRTHATWAKLVTEVSVGNVTIDRNHGRFRSIAAGSEFALTFYSDAAAARLPRGAAIWNVRDAQFVDHLPASGPVVVCNQALASRAGPGDDALGG